MKEMKYGLFIFIFFCSLYAVFSVGRFGGDGYQDYLTARNIVLNGNLSLYSGKIDTRASDLGIDFPIAAGRTGRDGRVYSSKTSFGMSFLLTPFYLSGYIASQFLKSVPRDHITMLCVSFANPIFTAINCCLVFLIACRNFSFKPRTSAIVSLLYGLSTMAPVYARTGFAEPAVTALLLMSAMLLFNYSASFQKKELVLSALFAGFMFFAKVSSIIFVPCLFIYLVLVLKDRKLGPLPKLFDALLFVCIFTLIFFGTLILNFFIYGSAFKFGATDALEMGKRITASAHMLKGLYYYTLSTGKGFFLFNIPVILVFFCLPKAFKSGRYKTLLAILIFLMNLLFYVKSFRRGSLFSWGPRYLFMSVPFLVILTGYFIEAAASRIKRAAVWLCGLAGFIVMLPCMLVGQSRFYPFLIEKLGIDEYMINFIPDLSPIKGVWNMLISRTAYLINGHDIPFVYSPDYRLVKPVSSSIISYNGFDIWFLKVKELAPSLTVVVYSIVLLLALISVFSAVKIIRSK